MSNITDRVTGSPLLDALNDSPRSATRKEWEWFRMTRRIIQDTISEMVMDQAPEAEEINAFTGAGLIK